MPALAIHHNAVGVAKSGITGDALVDGTQNAALLLLALGIQSIELTGQKTGAVQIFRVEEIDHVASDVHAAGGIDAGRDAERNFGGSWRTLVRDLRHFEQSLQS